MPSLKLVSRYPVHLDIESTNVCNLKCSMCMRTFMKDEVGYISWDTYRHIFNEYIPYSIKLNWRGEPLLHPELGKLILYAKNIGVHEVLLNTNGLLLTEELIWHLCYCGLDKLSISVDGATKSTYENIRIGGDFGKLVKNIMLVNSVFEQAGNRPELTLQICKQDLNKNEIGEWVKLFKPYADKLRIGRLFDPQGKYGLKIKQPRNCSQLWQRLTISWQGDILPCPSDYLGRFKLGNIRNTTIYDAWHSPKLNLSRFLLAKYGRNKTYLCSNCSSYC